MRRIVFGLGAAQVGATLVLVVGAGLALGFDWRAALALGGIAAMSSTAIVSKMLADRLELNSQHGRQIIGILLFQDLAVVPLLIVIPALAQEGGNLSAVLGVALLKAAVALALILYSGQRLMRGWFHVVAMQKSSELFMLNVLFITLGLSFLTEMAGLSLALGAFLAGMLISETEYRYQVEDDIKPFRDVLLGLFFVTIGMLLDLGEVLDNLWAVSLLLVAGIVLKAALIAGLSRLFGAEPGIALRTGLDLAQAGEFGFVLLAATGKLNLLDAETLQTVLAAMLLSMLIAPFIIEHSEHLVRRWSGAEWLNRAMVLHNIAVQTMAADQHVIVCGYGRSGQSLARLLEQEDVPYIALDFDPQRVKAAATAGENVVYGDAGRREVLTAAGLARAKALVVTYANAASALRVLSQVQDLRPGLPVVVRTHDDTDLDQLKAAGAAEVVTEIMEGSLMLAFHALTLVGVPVNRVMGRMREIRGQRYSLLRGFFRGVTDEKEELSEKMQPRLRSLLVAEGAAAVGKTLGELDLTGVEITAVRRRNIRGLAPAADTLLQEGDVVVLLGSEEALAAAEIKLMQG